MKSKPSPLDVFKLKMLLYWLKARRLAMCVASITLRFIHQRVYGNRGTPGPH